MSARREVRFWVAQRLTATVLAVCVTVHIVTIILAVRGGLTAAEILDRTRGSVVLAAFYGTFVVAAAIHGAIGLRNVASEWLGWRGGAADLALAAFALLLTGLGFRAVWAVYA
jgi:fumarate reductase subunit C